MTSSEPKNCLWIFCPQMTLHDIPKIPQIGVKWAGLYSGRSLEWTVFKVNGLLKWTLIESSPSFGNVKFELFGLKVLDRLL